MLVWAHMHKLNSDCPVGHSRLDLRARVPLLVCQNSIKLERYLRKEVNEGIVEVLRRPLAKLAAMLVALLLDVYDRSLVSI